MVEFFLVVEKKKKTFWKNKKEVVINHIKPQCEACIHNNEARSPLPN
jgi:hypothetical protein